MPRSLLEKLQALERSTRGTASAVQAGSLDGAPRSDESAQVGAASLEAAATVVRRKAVDSPAAVAESLHALGFQQKQTAAGWVWCRTLTYDLLTRHGLYRFSDLLRCDLKGLLKAAKTGLELENDAFGCLSLAHRFRFYDTETTGLGTGAGTFPFLHSVGLIEDDEFLVNQYFLADYSEEEAVLLAVLEDLAGPHTILVTFNGKSFDWPLFENRLVLYHREEARRRPHIDLLYPSRRLWRHQLLSVSLASLEASFLDLHRHNDLPGKEAPSRYFAFLDNGEAQTMDPVFEHNAADVCSLVTLAIFLSEILSGNRSVETTHEYVALAKWYDEWQEYDSAVICLDKAILRPDATWQAFWLRGLHAKRRSRWELACEIWQQMAERFPWSIRPLVELAKCSEHQWHDYEQARTWIELALSRAGMIQQARLHLEARPGACQVSQRSVQPGDPSSNMSMAPTAPSCLISSEDSHVESAVQAVHRVGWAGSDAAEALYHRLERVRRKLERHGVFRE